MHTSLVNFVTAVSGLHNHRSNHAVTIAIIGNHMNIHHSHHRKRDETNFCFWGRHCMLLFVLFCFLDWECLFYCLYSVQDTIGFSGNKSLLPANGFVHWWSRVSDKENEIGHDNWTVSICSKIWLTFFKLHRNLKERFHGVTRGNFILSIFLRLLFPSQIFAHLRNCDFLRNRWPSPRHTLPVPSDFLTICSVYFLNSQLFGLTLAC